MPKQRLKINQELIRAILLVITRDFYMNLSLFSQFVSSRYLHLFIF